MVSILCLSGCRTDEHGPVLKDLFHTSFFKVNVVKDADTVELCGAMKVSGTPFVLGIAVSLGNTNGLHHLQP